MFNSGVTSPHLHLSPAVITLVPEALILSGILFEKPERNKTKQKHSKEDTFLIYSHKGSSLAHSIASTAFLIQTRSGLKQKECFQDNPRMQSQVFLSFNGSTSFSFPSRRWRPEARLQRALLLSSRLYGSRVTLAMGALWFRGGPGGLSLKPAAGRWWLELSPGWDSPAWEAPGTVTCPEQLRGACLQ